MKERSLADIDLFDRQCVEEFEGFLKLLLHRRFAWPAYRSQLVEEVPARSGARKSRSVAAPLGPVGGLSPGGGIRDFCAVSESVTVNFSSAGLYPFALYCAQEIGICRRPYDTMTDLSGNTYRPVAIFSLPFTFDRRFRLLVSRPVPTTYVRQDTAQVACSGRATYPQLTALSAKLRSDFTVRVNAGRENSGPSCLPVRLHRRRSVPVLRLRRAR
jgi:hypothetical protein